MIKSSMVDFRKLCANVQIKPATTYPANHLPVFVDEESIDKEDKKDFILSIARSSSLVIAVLAFLLFATRALKRVSSPHQQVAAGYATYTAPAEIETGGVIDEAEVARLNKLEEQSGVVREGVIETAKNDPKTTSNLVRKWLRESE